MSDSFRIMIRPLLLIVILLHYNCNNNNVIVKGFITNHRRKTITRNRKSSSFRISNLNNVHTLVESPKLVCFVTNNNQEEETKRKKSKFWKRPFIFLRNRFKKKGNVADDTVYSNDVEESDVTTTATKTDDVNVYHTANVLDKGEEKEDKDNDNEEETEEEEIEIVEEKEEVDQDDGNRKPTGDRWAISAEEVDMSGSWKPIVDTKFKQEYDDYLKCCGQNMLFRNLAKSVLGLVTEVISQNNTALTISGTTPAGTWKRTLISSGTDLLHDTFEPVFVNITDPDGDVVQVESYWDNDGQTHVSILRGKPRVKGGVFETRRSLLHDDSTNTTKLICESIFIANDDNKSTNFQSANVTWSFQKIST